MGITGIIGAMASEVELLKAAMEEGSEMEIAGRDFSYGLLEGRPVVVVQCGEGKTSAAICAQAMVDRFHVDRLINTGVAGGLAAELRVGDLVIGTDAVHHDFDLTALGYVRGYVAGGDGQKPTRFQADTELISLCKRAAAQMDEDISCLEGTIASGDIFVDDSGLKRHLIEQFGAAAAEMEGAAIAQTAQANGVPFVLIRAISDLAEQEANVSFASFEKQAADRSARLVMRMLTLLSEEL